MNVFRSRVGRWIFVVTMVMGLAGLAMASGNDSTGPSQVAASPGYDATNSPQSVAVPEPPALALFVLGTMAIAWTHRRQTMRFHGPMNGFRTLASPAASA